MAPLAECLGASISNSGASSFWLEDRTGTPSAETPIKICECAAGATSRHVRAQARRVFRLSVRNDMTLILDAMGVRFRERLNATRTMSSLTAAYPPSIESVLLPDGNKLKTLANPSSGFASRSSDDLYTESRYFHSQVF
jgi:hypothetical protein